MPKYTDDARRQPLYFFITTVGRDKTMAARFLMLRPLYLFLTSYVLEESKMPDALPEISHFHKMVIVPRFL